MKQYLDDVGLFDLCRGAKDPWSICKVGNAKHNARLLQNWLLKRTRYWASLRTCAKVCAEIRRLSKQEVA